MYITLKLEDKLRFGYDILLHSSKFLPLLSFLHSYHLNSEDILSFLVSIMLFECFFNRPVLHTNLFTVVRGELTVPEEALKVL